MLFWKKKRDLPLICRSMRSLAMIFYNEIITGIFVEYTDMKIKSFLKLIYFLIEGWLLYRILYCSVKQKHESAIGVHTSPPSRTSLPSITKVKDRYFMQSECHSFKRIREEEWTRIMFYSTDFNNFIISLLL